MTKPSIAIVGAGFSGIILAQKLKNIGEVKIFEKARGVGGRMASRLKDDFNFDFGAQFFTAKKAEFQDFLKPFIEQQILLPWCGNFAEIVDYIITYQREWPKEKNHFVPAIKMNQFCKELSQDLDISLQTRVAKIEKNAKKWQIFDDKNNFLGEFDWIFFSIPAPQLSELIPQNCNFFEATKNIKMLGCFALMLGLEKPLNLSYDVALVKNSIISWISFENSKPQRKKSASYTILARNDWADCNIENDINEVKNQLIAEFSKIIQQPLNNIIHQDIHRWRYANIAKQKNNVKFFLDDKMQLGACGDWLIHGRVEASYLSASALFNEIAKNLT
jgi:renalase